MSETLAVAPPDTGAAPRPAAAFWQAFAENRGALGGLAVMTGLVLLAVAAPMLAPHDPAAQFRDHFLAPPR